MAAGDTANVRIWTGAEVYVGDFGSTAPTDLSTALDADFELLGLISQDDGISGSFSDTETEHWAYGNVLVRTTNTKSKETFQVVALENSDVVYKLSNPGSTSATATGVTTRTYKAPDYSTAIKAVVLELTDGDVTSRMYMPKVQFKRAGSTDISDNAMAARTLVGTILDGTISGTTARRREWTDDTAAAV